MIVANLLSLLLALFTAAATADALPLPDARARLADAALEVQVRSVLRDLDGEFGLAVVSFRDGRSFSINADRPFQTASLYKLLVAYRVYRQIESGAMSLNDPITIAEEDTASSLMGTDLEAGHELTVGEALRAMITWSSNSAAGALVRTSGGWSGVLEGADELGIQAPSKDDQFLIRPVDFVSFYEKLATGRMLNRAHSDELLTLLLQQEINDRIPALLPKTDVQVAHKTGELEDIRNDAGIVFGPRDSYIIVMMSSGASAQEATSAEAAVSRLVYDSYEAQ